jgi:hypothetical protein
VRVCGMSHNSQWFQVRSGASGSSMINAKLRVSSGSPDQAKAGDMS